MVTNPSSFDYSQLVPTSGEDRIAPPTPEPSPCMERCNRRGDSSIYAGSRSQADGSGSNGSSSNNNSGVAYVPRRLRGSDLSLTTITEEPPSWTSSHEIVVQPEVVVETTTCNGNGSCNSARSASEPSSGSECSSSSSGSSPPMATISHGRHFTTKVTATAKVKVEVHAPIHSSSMEPSYYKHRRRRDN